MKLTFLKKKKFWVFFVIALIILYIVVSIITSANKPPEYVTQIAEKGTLKQTVDVTGSIESADKIDLSFKTSGRIARIYVEAGDEVKAGQVLATLESRALASRVDDARGSLKQAEADLDRILSGASAADIFVSENTVAQQQQTLEAAKDSRISLLEKQYTELKNYKESLISTMGSELVVSKAAMEEIENTLSDPDAKKTLSAKNSQALRDVENLQSEALENIGNAEFELASISYLSDDKIIIDTSSNIKDVINLVGDTLSRTLDVLAATITSSDLTEAELDALKSNIKGQQVKSNASISSLQTALSNWTNRIAYYEDQLIAADNAITNAERALTTAISQLDLKKAPPRNFEVDSARASVDRARASLNLALANLDETIILSPIDGTITKKNLQAGEQASLSMAVLEMIGESKLQIEVDIPESDIAKIEVGQDVEITLDAFGDEEVFAGVVTFVDPAETIIQDVVYYKVKVQINENQTLNIKPGMTANVVICTDQKNNVIFVPARSVKGGNGDKYVEVLEDGEAQEKTVTTGIKGDDGIEILSGINEGDEVITFVKNGN